MVAAQQATASPQLRIYRGEDLQATELHDVMARPRIDFESILQTVGALRVDVALHAIHG